MLNVLVQACSKNLQGITYLEYVIEHKLNFSRSALFHMKTRVCLQCIVYD